MNIKKLLGAGLLGLAFAAIGLVCTPSKADASYGYNPLPGGLTVIKPVGYGCGYGGYHGGYGGWGHRGGWGHGGWGHGGWGHRGGWGHGGWGRW